MTILHTPHKVRYYLNVLDFLRLNKRIYMELYGSYTSPFVRHCRIALLQTQQDCQFIETDAQQSATLSPTKKVPYSLIVNYN